MRHWGDDIQFWAGALSFPLTTLANIKKLTIPSFLNMDAAYPRLFFQTRSRFEEVYISYEHREMATAPRLLEFYASQPAIRKLSIDGRKHGGLPVPNTVLLALETLVCPLQVARLYFPGHSIREVSIHPS